MIEIHSMLIHKNATIREAMQIIEKGALGIALIVDDNDVLIGIVTDGDIRRAILQEKDLETNVESIMVTKPITVREKTTNREIVEIFRTQNVAGKIPLIDKYGKVIDLLLSTDFISKGEHLPVSEQVKKVLVAETNTIKETMRTIDRSGFGIAFVVDMDKRLLGVATDGDIRHAIINGINLQNPIRDVMNRDPIILYEQVTPEVMGGLLKNKKIRERLPKAGALKVPILYNDGCVKDIGFIYDEKAGEGSVNKLIFKDRPVGKEDVKTVLVIGGAGYMGSTLIRKLLENNYHVRVLDNLMYGDEGIRELFENPHLEFINGDMRNLQTVMDAVRDVDAVIHLAAIVGDPASKLDPKETIEINYLGTKMLAEVCKYSQVNRFLFASTCSVYGASPTPEHRLTEESEVNPLSLYAEMKLKSEDGILNLVDENFSPTIFRMGTLYGLSPRMRFDLVVNTLTAKAIVEKKITIFGGNQWRPNVHAADASEAYIHCLKAPIEKVRGKIFNLGSNQQNHKIIEIGNFIKEIISDAEIIIDTQNVDERNYNVSFDRITEVLRFETKKTISDAIWEIKSAFENGSINNYNDSKYYNHKYLKGE